MVRKLFALLSLVAMIFALAIPVSAGKLPAVVRVLDTVEYGSPEVATNYVADLNAGQHVKVGELFIDALGGDHYLVTYKLTEDDLYFGQIHFEAISDNVPGFDDDSDLVYGSGGLIPGQLTAKKTFLMPVVDEITGIVSGGTRQYSFIYHSGADVDSFAAHSVVYHAKVEEYFVTVQTGTETKTGSIASNETLTGVVQVREPFDYLDPAAPDISVWDDAFATSPAWATKLVASGAEFIWNYELSSGLTGSPVPTSNDLTVYGDVMKVDVPVNVPMDATEIAATLYIVADNGYIAKIGDQIINFAGFNPTNYAALTPEVELATEASPLLLEIFPTLRSHDGITPFFDESVVPSNAWNSMIAVGSNVPLVPGANTVNIAAVNEHMAGGTDYNNPAGVIFFIEYSWKVPTYEQQKRYRLTFTNETAWGMGEDAEGSNWSQIITNIPECDAPVVENGGFEAPTIISTSGWKQYAATVDGIDWNIAFSVPRSGTPLLELQNDAALPEINAFEGDQYAELDSDHPVAIFQTINTCRYCTYKLSFEWSPRSGSGDDILQVWWNGTLIDTLKAGTDVAGWRHYEKNLLVPAIGFETELKFVETGVDNSYGMFLDNVVVAFD